MERGEMLVSKSLTRAGQPGQNGAAIERFANRDMNMKQSAKRFHELDCSRKKKSEMSESTLRETDRRDLKKICTWEEGNVRAHARDMGRAEDCLFVVKRRSVEGMEEVKGRGRGGGRGRERTRGYDDQDRSKGTEEV
eukprot:763130-Hanusia_phi.AAC.2